MGSPHQLINPRLNVLMDDGAWFEDVRTITSDFMRWEKTRVSLGLPSREADPLPFMHYIAWHALRRTGQIEVMTFAQFIGGEFEAGRCFEVNMADADAVDPTNRDPGSG
jgi:hypothetical protein